MFSNLAGISYGSQVCEGASQHAFEFFNSIVKTYYVWVYCLSHDSLWGTFGGYYTSPP